MTQAAGASSAWEQARTRLCAQVPALYELEPGGALALELNSEGWMLELTPSGDLICQTGMDIDDLKALLSEGTCEDLGTDEIAKQAKALMNRTVSVYRPLLMREGFEERTDMNEQYVAVLFSKPVDFNDVDQVVRRIQWCRQQFRA